MEGLFSLLLFAAFFYFMMRFGCGAHMVHGHGGHEPHGDHDLDRTVEGAATDPVCGMSVKPGEGYTKMDGRRQYRFCSRQCLDRFEAEPQRYATARGGSR